MYYKKLLNFIIFLTYIFEFFGFWELLHLDYDIFIKIIFAEFVRKTTKLFFNFNEYLDYLWES